MYKQRHLNEIFACHLKAMFVSLCHATHSILLFLSIEKKRFANKWENAG
jgi:hypothetical protein